MKESTSSKTKRTRACSWKQWHVTQLVLVLLCSLSIFYSCTSAFSLTPPTTRRYDTKESYDSTHNLGHRYNQRGRHCRRCNQQQSSIRLWSSSACLEGDEKSDAEVKQSFYIRKAMYSDLTQVADIVMASFYTKKQVSSSLWYHLYRLGELNRLQLNFPYSDPQHVMLVACATTDMKKDVSNECSSMNRDDPVVAFCDVDARRPVQPPKHAAIVSSARPYLSDLCIHPQWRRQGIALELIAKCQEIVVHDFQQDDLYIGVQQDNVAALQLYTVKLNYRQATIATGAMSSSSTKEHGNNRNQQARHVILLHKTLTNDNHVDQDFEAKVENNDCEPITPATAANVAENNAQ